MIPLKGLGKQGNRDSARFSPLSLPVRGEFTGQWVADKASSECPWGEGELCTEIEPGQPIGYQPQLVCQGRGGAIAVSAPQALTVISHSPMAFSAYLHFAIG